MRKISLFGWNFTVSLRRKPSKIKIFHATSTNDIAASNVRSFCSHSRKWPVGISQQGNGVHYTYKCLTCNEALGSETYSA